MIIKREQQNILIELARQYPVVTITGPRQSGKTTLVQSAFPDFQYFSMEDPDIREIAISDPRQFLNKHGKGMILDEIQKTPELLSYIQGIVDKHRNPGMFILTGSQQFDLHSKISQSLAGRTAILYLLPFTINELSKMKSDFTVDEYLLYGFYPGIHDKKQDPNIAYKNYFQTYIERDLRQIVNIKDLNLFQKFVRLCAGRIGQVFSASSLSNDIGVSVPTINSWISILKASYILFTLEPYSANIGKRLIKSPKLYFYDVGIASYLLGIENINQLSRDPLRGNLFENMVILEMLKTRFNIGRDHNLFFYRDSNKNEVDVLYKKGNQLIPVEIKSAETFTKDFLKGLEYIKKVFPENIENSYILYAGDFEQQIENSHLINFKNTSSIIDNSRE